MSFADDVADRTELPPVADLSAVRAARANIERVHRALETKVDRANQLVDFLNDQVTMLLGDYPAETRARAAQRIERMWAAASEDDS